jgi:DHA1 family bicyclomycin/chloramphenicol resistance-like MFS transporter
MPHPLHSPPTLLLVGFAALAPMSIDMYLPAMASMSSQLDASPDAMTATLSVFIGGLALGQLAAGPWSDRVGRIVPITSGLCLYLLGAVWALMSSDVAMLLVGRVLQALGASAVMVAGRAVVRDLFEEREAARYFSTLALVSGLAPILAPMIGTAMLAISGWRAVFGLMAMLALTLIVFVRSKLVESRLEKPSQKGRSAPFRSYWILLRNPRALGFLLAAGFNGACLFTYLGASPLVLLDGYGLTPTTFSAVVAVNALGLMAASQWNRVLLKRYSPQQILFGSSLGSLVLAVGCASVGILLIASLPALLLAIFAVTSSLSFIQANTMACTLSIDPQRAGAAAALFGFMGYAMGASMSLLAGLLYDGTSRPMLLVIATSLIGSAASLRLLALRKRT